MQADHTTTAGAPTRLGGLLRSLRQRAMLTQEELAERSGVSVSTIAGLESGRTRAPRRGSVRLLAAALGLTGEQLRELAVAIDEPAARHTGGPVPAQLPADPAHFTGRADHLARLDGLLPSDPDTRPPAVVIAVLFGAAGIGKTTLAVRWAHRIRDRFPDGQLYVNLRGWDPAAPAMDPAEAVRGFLDAFEVPPARVPANLDGQVGLYRSLLAGRRVLVVLDNARDADQVRPLLPGSPGCVVVVTSRSQLSGLLAADGAHPAGLDLLSTDEARQLLAYRLGAGRVAAEPDPVDQIVAGCARLPLALAVVAARAATRPDFPLAAVAAELRAAGGGLEAFAGTDPLTDVRAVFSWSYRALSADAARLFRLLGLPAGPDLAAPAIASLAGLALARANRLLAELAGCHLVAEPVPGRYALHDLLRAYAGELAHAEDPEPERRAAVRRLLDHRLHTAYAANQLLDPHRDPIDLIPAGAGVTPEPVTGTAQALAWFTVEYAGLLAAIEQAAAAGFDGHAWQLAWTLETHFHRAGRWHDQAVAMRTALAAAGRLGDRGGQARIHRYLGLAETRKGRHDDAYAHYRRQLALFAELGDRVGRGRAHLDIGWLLSLQERRVESLRERQQALVLFEEAGHLTGQALALNNIGFDHGQLGDYQQAVRYCRRALEIHQEADDRWGQATTLDSLGYAYHHLGDHQQAIGCYRRALALYREVGERYHWAETLTNLGDTLRAIGDTGAARESWQQALATFDDLGHPDRDEVRDRLDRLA
jgi:tetratricopeptide (TPR) repeat protein/transcriptional regulator with XRE-family HTH domain